MSRIHIVSTLLIGLFALGLISQSGCTKPTHVETIEVIFVDFDSLVAAYHEDGLRLFPLSATSAGDNRYNDTLTNTLTNSFRNQLNNHYSHYLDKLKKCDSNDLNVQQKLSFDVLKWECQSGLDALKFPSHLLPIDQFWTLNITMGRLASGRGSQPFNSKEDYDNWLSRLGDYMTWCDTAIQNMRIGIKQGIVLPKPLIKKVIPQMQALSYGYVRNHLFYKPVLQIPDSISIKDKKSIRASYSQYLSQTVIPMYRKLTTFFRDEYLPAGRVTDGIGNLPMGASWYQERIRHYTTTDMQPLEIFELGKSEVERLEESMAEVMKEVAFFGTLKEFFVHLRNLNTLMPYFRANQVIENFENIHKKMQPNIGRLFDKVPKTEFEIRRTEAFREASASAEYSTGSVDGSRPGIFYVPIPDVLNYNILSDEDLFLHEAIPGHHFQESMQRENEELPMFRKLMWNSAYGEGWALYTESLGKELGLYTDPYQYFGMLSAEMHRAIRLVVDVGIHHMGWTREQAIAYSLEHEAEGRASIVPEIERYMAGPGQALSYKIGQLKILELRALAEKELGDQFDIREFHNTILETGCVPLKVLEGHVKRWIKKEKEAI